MSLLVYQFDAIIDKLAAQTLIKRNADGFIVTYVNFVLFYSYITVA